MDILWFDERLENDKKFSAYISYISKPKKRKT